jgi:glycosyltransferase involved in cell wall biosynthesis
MAQLPLWLGGTVFAYPAHQAYFQTEIAPRLGPDARFLGPVGWHRKRRLLSAARCLLVPSLVPETSSLVAMEALACDTPVIAYRAGALAEIVEHGKTGFLVANPSEMAEAIRECDTLPKGQCRAKARVRFSLEPMLQAYFTAYHRLASRGRHRQSKGVEWIASWS